MIFHHAPTPILFFGSHKSLQNLIKNLTVNPLNPRNPGKPGVPGKPRSPYLEKSCKFIYHFGQCQTLSTFFFFSVCIMFIE